MAHPYASQVKASQRRRMSSLHAKEGKAWGSVNVDLKNSYPKKNAGTQREYTISGATSKPRADRYAKGGKVKKGNTTNVIIAQPKPDAAAARPVPVPVPVRPPMRPPIAAAPAAPAPVGAPVGALPMASPTGGMPPSPPAGARPPGLASGGSVKKADGGFLKESPGETYRGFPHSPTSGVDDAVSAHKRGGAIKKESATIERSEKGEDNDTDDFKRGGGVKKRAFGGLGGAPMVAPMPPRQRAALAMKGKGKGMPQAGLGAMPGARPPMYKAGGAKKADGGAVEAGAGSGLGRLRESAIAAKVPATTES